MEAFEVRFRGEAERQLLAWRPSVRNTFGSSRFEAQLRYNKLVRAGLDGQPIDGIVPYVVEIVHVKRKMRKEGMGCLQDSMLRQIAEPNGIQEGPWADNTDLDLSDVDLSIFGGDADEPDNEHEPVNVPIAA
jgi:hypothetical protein